MPRILGPILLISVPFCGCCRSAEEWKPTGDGRTVVNTVTGEIKYTSTGLSREEFDRRRKEQEEAFWINNRDRYERIKTFVVSPAAQKMSATFEPAFGRPWDSFSETFELDKWLSEQKRDELLSLALSLQKNEARYPDTKNKLPHPQWEELIEDLKNLQY
jgi:hypothetical protein